MKKSLSNTLSVLLLLGMVGCTGQMNAIKKLDWYVGQGGKLDDCGPASAAMAVNWAGGKSNLQHAKSVTRNSGWWLFKDIAQHLHKQDIATYQARLQDLPALLKQGDGAIMRTAVLGMPHYVFVSGLDAQNRLLVADPLKGKKHINIQQLPAMMLDKVVLAVRNTPENPVNEFDLKRLPWLKSGRMVGRIPVINRPIIQRAVHSNIY